MAPITIEWSRGPAASAALVLAAACALPAGADVLERIPHVDASFNVLAYNIYMRPTSLFRNDQADRGRALPPHLRRFDAIVFSEAFDDGVRHDLLADLAAEYPHRTGILGRDHADGRQDGGVIIVSRWPITAEYQRLFGDVCVGDLSDCLADKGVLYARIEKHGRAHHLFGSHTQAGDSSDRRAARAEQLRVIKAFVDSIAPPDFEPVFIAGDLNVDRYDDREYALMLEILDAWQPRPFGHPYTVDDTANTRAGSRSYLDYVLVSNRHLQPIDAAVETLMPRSPIPFGGDYELSDHFPVFARFMFPSPAHVLAVLGR